jgi:hypothetical protein
MKKQQKYSPEFRAEALKLITAEIQDIRFTSKAQISVFSQFPV